MKLPLAALIALAVGTIMAQEPTPAPPPVVVRVQVNVISLAPVNVPLLSVVMSAIGNPDELRVVLLKLTVQQLSSVIIGLTQHAESLKVVLNALSFPQIDAVIIGMINNPSALRVVLAQLGTDQITAILLKHAASPDKLLAIVRAIPADKLKAIAVTTPEVADIVRWMPVIEWLNTPGNSRNWLAIEKVKIAAAIQKDGYTPDILGHAESVIAGSKK